MKDSGAQGVQVSHVPFQLMLSIDGIRIGQLSDLLKNKCAKSGSGDSLHFNF